MATKKEIENMSDTQLIIAFHDNVVRGVKEINFGRYGRMTGATVKEEEFLQAEMSKRFNLNKEELYNGTHN
ncbi:ssDNA binding protein [Bacillus phage vB_BcgM]|nr:ssDNA binding protein [Bacillus phage vB_BcgM]